MYTTYTFVLVKKNANGSIITRINLVNFSWKLPNSLN